MWKVRREIKRFGQQLKAIPEFFYEQAAQRRHDQAFEEGFPLVDGKRPLTKKVALLLIYQPNDLSESTIETCKHMAKLGYSPMLISNTRLHEADLERLKPHVWKILLRPNFGYDFGGYRDGIKLLWKWGLTPDCLLIMNDSIWFPLNSDETLLEKMEQKGVDVAGAVLHVRRSDSWRHKSKRHLESYCYLISGQTFTAKAFHIFWQKLNLTSNKYKVIRRGERGHSLALMQADFTLGAIYTHESFIAELSQKPNEFLHKVILYAAHKNQHLIESRQNLLLDEHNDQSWRKSALKHFEDTLDYEEAHSTFPYAMVHLFQYPILKKSGDTPSKLWRKMYLKAVDAGDIPAPDPVFLEEIRSKVKTDMV